MDGGFGDTYHICKSSHYNASEMVIATTQYFHQVFAICDFC